MDKESWNYTKHNKVGEIEDSKSVETRLSHRAVVVGGGEGASEGAERNHNGAECLNFNHSRNKS